MISASSSEACFGEKKGGQLTRPGKYGGVCFLSQIAF